LARISAEAQATAQALTMTIEVDLRECEKMLAVCAREWRQPGMQPRIEDFVLRALARAAIEASLPAHSAGLVMLGRDSDVATAVEQPANTALRDAVQARASGAGPAFEAAEWVLVSLAELGIASATPRLPAGHAMSFALGATRTGSATLTMAYDSASVGEGPTARLLARARDILEAPYTMLL
jgi:hypothetical protein